MRPIIKVLLASLLLFSFPAFGASIYTTSFEVPTFSNGSALVSLDNWITGPFSNSTSLSVSNLAGNPFPGQSIQLIGNTAANTSGAVRPVNYTVPAGNLILLYADVFVPSNASRNISFDLSGYEGTSLLNQLIGYVRVTPTLNIQVFGAAQNNTAAVLAPDAWSRLGIWANFDNRTFNVTLNNTTIASNIAFAFNTNTSNTMYAGGIAVNGPGNGTTNGVVYVDNFSISNEVPEPTTVLLTSSAILFFVLRRKK
jgi:hypothetical protein